MGGALAEPRSDFETESIMSTINTSPSYWIGKIGSYDRFKPSYINFHLN